MKYCLIFLLLIKTPCCAQNWDVEIMAGTAGYAGDLTQKTITYRTPGPSVGINVKHNFNNDVIVLRGGITWGRVSGNDKYNNQDDLKRRNFSFQTNIFEGSLCAEVNLFEPEFFSAYPYVFAGVGVFRFNPYTYDNNNVKEYLQPIGTEGQGLPLYPERKPYSLTQFCLPFGGGMKINISKTCDLIYEIGGRVLFTDYLDDVSTTYVNIQALLAGGRPKAAELAYRHTQGPFPREGDIRGNAKVRDWYFINGFKLLFRLGKSN